MITQRHDPAYRLARRLDAFGGYGGIYTGSGTIKTEDSAAQRRPCPLFCVVSLYAVYAISAQDARHISLRSICSGKSVFLRLSEQKRAPAPAR